MRTSALAIQTDVFKSIKEEAFKASTTKEVWKPASEKRFFLQGLIFSFSSTAAFVIVQDEATAIFELNLKAIAATEVPLQIALPVGYESIKTNNKLKLEFSAESAKVSVVAYGTETP